MEFLRFGSSIPGGYWGCCAVCIIQNFKFDPDDKASIQIVSGDGGNGITNSKGEALFAGPTYRDIFKQRIRVGTFHNGEMPNHAFFAVLTESQISGGYGSAWLKILKEEGFEFLRTQDNSVYTGHDVPKTLPKGSGGHPNHIFALFRNISGSRIKDPFTPPKQWTELGDVVPETWQMVEPKVRVEFATELSKVHHDKWIKDGKVTLLTEAEIVAAGAPVIMAGQRLPHAGPESKAKRNEAKAEKKAGKVNAFPTASAA